MRACGVRVRVLGGVPAKMGRSMLAVAELEVSSVIPTVKKQIMKSIKNTGT